MKILIEGSSVIRRRTGIGEYTKNLVFAMAKLEPRDRFVLSGFCFFTRKCELPGGTHNLSYKLIKYLPGRIYNRLLIHHLSPPIDLLACTKADVALFPNFVRHSLLWPISSITIIYDLVFLHFPKYMETDHFHRFLRQAVPQAIERSSHLVTISESTKRDIVKIYGIEKDQVSVVTPAINHEQFKPSSSETIASVRQKYSILKPYLLYLGTLEPRKNVDGILSAYAKLPQALQEQYQLVLAGGRGWKDTSIQRAIANFAQGRVVVTGYVQDEDKPALYSGAALFLYPSHYEGWGMQILEAMACGTPVISARNSSLPEAGGDAAFYIDDSHSVRQLTTAVKQLLSQPRRLAEMRQAGLKHVRAFSWDKSAKEMLEIIHRVGARGK